MHSNTSHVLIYLLPSVQIVVIHFIQIHLMFLFITRLMIIVGYPQSIQIHLMFLFIGSCSPLQSSCSAYSNTSHVLIYRKVYHGTILYDAFKYISCSYLSFNNPTAISSYLFKYISCSYLSRSAGNENSFTIYSNTSHVLIYQENAW